LLNHHDYAAVAHDALPFLARLHAVSSLIASIVPEAMHHDSSRIADEHTIATMACGMLAGEHGIADDVPMLTRSAKPSGKKYIAHA